MVDSAMLEPALTRLTTFFGMRKIVPEGPRRFVNLLVERELAS